MTTLGTAIVESILVEYGPSEFLSRISDPFWFQALGSVMGMDWHSSGVTTSVMGALKRGLNPRSSELNLFVCGGRGKQSRQTPRELIEVGDQCGLDGDDLVRTSRLTAKIDNGCIADGFQIYLHSFVVSAEGEWAVVQQGMNSGTGLARRYHWHSASVRDFVDEPHTGIVGQPQGEIMNLIDRRAEPARHALLDIARGLPDRTLAHLRHLRMPTHHDVRAENVDHKRLGAVLALAHDRELRSLADLLLVENVGPRTLQTLAMVAEVIHGTPVRFCDPARFSFALGGKDGHPYPVPLKIYDQAIDVLRTALDKSKVDGREKLDGFRRLNQFVQAVEKNTDTEVDLPAFVAHEKAISPALGGRTVFDDKRRLPRQMSLF